MSHFTPRVVGGKRTHGLIETTTFAHARLSSHTGRVHNSVIVVGSVRPLPETTLKLGPNISLFGSKPQGASISVKHEMTACGTVTSSDASPKSRNQGSKVE